MTDTFFEHNFALSIGPQRSGTSWIDRYLRSRGDVCMPQGVKEIFFFDRHFERGPEFYYSHFKPNPKHKLLMEISTTAFDHMEAPKRVYSMFGENVQLICPLRHPVERSYSLYLHLFRYGLVRGTLEEAVLQAPQILNSSRYAQHLEVWYQYFKPDNIHIFYQEDLEAQQSAYVESLCDVLKLPYIDPADDISGRYNVTASSRFPTLAHAAQKTADFLRAYKMYFAINLGKKLGLKDFIFGPEVPDAKRAMMSREDHEWLSERLIPEIEKLEKLLGDQIKPWRVFATS